MRPSSHDEQERAAASPRSRTGAPTRRGGLSTSDQALLAAQHLAGNAAVAHALAPKRESAAPVRTTSQEQPDALVLDAPAFDLQVPQGSFDHLLKGRRMRGHREIVERFERQRGVVPVAWTAGTGATAQERNTAWRVHQRTLVATSTLPRFTAVSADAPGLPGPVTTADALLAGLPRSPRSGRGGVRLSYAGDPVVGGAARVTSRKPDDSTLVVEMAFAQGTLVMTGRRDVQGDHLDWDTELTIDLDALARVLWRDVFDRLETRRKGGIKKLKPAAAAGDPPKRKPRRIDDGDDDADRIEPVSGTGDEQGMLDERS
ncbi:MAG TPA: hypothetical protein VK906_08160 [Egicoccus sp.]|nr:hypothetical protein [Egicoccus sp.]HSK23133.1 hypothetical protein [Egicoccus sp.]